MLCFPFAGKNPNQKETRGTCLLSLRTLACAWFVVPAQPVDATLSISRPSLFQVSIESLCLSIPVVQFLFTTLTRLFHSECHRLKARLVIYAYNDHLRLLSPEPAVVDKPQFTRVE